MLSCVPACRPKETDSVFLKFQIVFPAIKCSEARHFVADIQRYSCLDEITNEKWPYKKGKLNRSWRSQCKCQTNPDLPLKYTYTFTNTNKPHAFSWQFLLEKQTSHCSGLIISEVKVCFNTLSTYVLLLLELLCLQIKICNSTVKR
jgi:hypothetical protein